MDMNEVNQQSPSPGLGGVFRMLGILAVIAAGCVGAMLVTGLIPQEAAQDWFIKGGMLLAIVAAVAVAIRLISARKA